MRQRIPSASILYLLIAGLVLARLADGQQLEHPPKGTLNKLGFEALGGIEPVETIAVLPFRVQSNLAGNQWLGTGLAETLTAKLDRFNDSQVEAMEQGYLRRLLVEHGVALANLDLSDPHVPKALAQLIQARFLVLGTAAVKGLAQEEATPVQVTIRILDMQTDEAYKFIRQSVMGQVFDLQNGLVEEVARVLKIQPTQEGRVTLDMKETTSLVAYRYFCLGQEARYAQQWNVAVQYLEQAKEAKEGEYYEAAALALAAALKEQKEAATTAEGKQAVRGQASQRADAAEVQLARENRKWYFVGLLRMVAEEYEKAAAAFEHYLQLADPIRPLQWRFQTGGRAWLSPVVAGDKVFVTAVNKRLFNYKDSYLYALEAATGKVRWRFETEGNINSSPVVAGKTVFVHSPGSLYALAADEGTVRWQFQTQRTVYLSLVVAGETVFVGSRDGRLYVLAADTGELRWQFQIPGQIHSSPVVAGETVFVSSNNGELYALATDTGHLRWQSRLRGGSSFESSVVVGETVFIGNGKLHALTADTGRLRWQFGIGGSHVSSDEVWSPVVVGETVFVTFGYGCLYAVEAATGALRWRFQTEGNIASSPVVAGETVFVGSKDQCLYALAENSGTLRWKFQTRGQIHSSPAVVGEMVFVGSKDHSLYALSAATGAQRWQLQTGAGIYSSPVMWEETVLVHSSDGNLYALDTRQYQKGGKETDALFAWGQSLARLGRWTEARRRFKEVVDRKRNYDATLYEALGRACDELGDGGGAVRAWHECLARCRPGTARESLAQERLWQLAGLRFRAKVRSRIVPSLGVREKTVFATSVDGSLYAIEAGAGALRWQFQTEKEINSRPVVGAETVFVCSYDKDDSFVYGKKWLYAVEAATGKLRWKFPTKEAERFSLPPPAPLVVGETIFVASQRDGLYALEAGTGEVRWKFPTEGAIFSSPVVVEETIFIGSNGTEGNLYALAADTGELQWQFPTGGTNSSLVATGETIFVGSNDTEGNLYALAVDTGELQWQLPTGRIDSPPMVVGETVYVVSRKGLFAVEAPTGTQRWQFLQTGIDSSPVVAGETVFVRNSTSEGILYALSAATGALRWQFPAGKGIYSPLVIGKTVFIVSTDDSLYALAVDTGMLRWQFQTEHEMMEVSTTSVQNKRTVIGYLEDGKKIALGEVVPLIVQGKTLFVGFREGLYSFDLRKIEELLQAGQYWWREGWQKPLSFALSSRDAAECERYLRRAWEHSKQDGDIQTKILRQSVATAAIYVAQGQEGRAEILASAMSQVIPPSGMTFYCLGQCYQSKGQVEAAIGAYPRAIEEPRTESWAEKARIALALLLVREDYPAAVELYAATLQQSSEQAQPHYELGQTLREKKQYGDALRAFQEACQRDPENPAIHNALAELLLTLPDETLRDAETALQHARSAYKLGRDQVPINHTLGLALYRCGQFAEALTVLQESLKAREEFPPDLYLLASCFAKLGQEEKARAHLARAMEAGLDNKMGMRWRPHQFRGEEKAALAVLEEAGISINWEDLLDYALSCQDAEECQSSLQEAWEWAQKSRRSNQMLEQTATQVAQFVGQDQKARAEMVTALMRQVVPPKGRGEFFSQLAQTLTRQEQYEESKTAFQEALRLIPNKGTLYRLIGLYMKQEQYAEVIAWCQKATTEPSPLSATLHLKLAELLLTVPDQTLHDAEKALKHARIAFELDPNDRRILHQAVLLHMGLEQYTEIIALLQKEVTEQISPSPLLHSLLAQLLLAVPDETLRDAGAALKHARIAYDLAYTGPSPNTNRGTFPLALYRCGRYPELEELLQAEGKDPEPFFLEAEAEWKRLEEEWKRAKERLRKWEKVETVQEGEPEGTGIEE